MDIENANNVSQVSLVSFLPAAFVKRYSSALRISSRKGAYILRFGCHVLSATRNIRWVFYCREGERERSRCFEIRCDGSNSLVGENEKANGVSFFLFGFIVFVLVGRRFRLTRMTVDLCFYKLVLFFYFFIFFYSFISNYYILFLWDF